MNTRFLIKTLTLGVLAACQAGSVQAVEFSGSGFLTLAAGKMFDAELSDGYVVVDYGQAGIYDADEVSIGPDSKLGLQGVLTFNPQWSATGQIVSRGAHDGDVNLEWLYATFQATDDLTLQFGRKRLPLFYYSESQDVGLSLPWVRLPAQAYGWDVVNFTGANLIHQGNLGGWSSTAEAYFGRENRKDNPYQQIYTGRDVRTDEKWTNIIGADWTLSRDWLELRLAAMRSNWETYDPESDSKTDNGKQTFISLASMVDYENWVVRAELSKIDRPDYDLTPEHDWAVLFGVGYRFGKWLPMLTHAEFHGDYDDPTVTDERTTNLALSLRYDLSASSAIKVQYDITHDNSTPVGGLTSYNDSGTYGDSKLLTISYDRVF